MAHVAVFDSGLGGVSILAALRQALPAQTSYSYCADSAYFPYGPRTESEIRARVRAVITALVHQTPRPDVVVVACNTASTAALDALRHDHPQIPFVGVVPAIKPAAAHSTSRVIGLLATPGTVRRAYSERLIADFASDCVVVRHGAPRLADLAEEILQASPAVDHLPTLAAIGAEIAPLFTDKRLDTVVLGCTHYPLLRPWLEQAAPWPVTWLDSGDAVARQVRRVLTDHSQPERPQPSPDQAAISWCTSAPTPLFRATLTRVGLPVLEWLPVHPALRDHGE